MRGVSLLVIWVMATSGCVSELLQENQDTVRNHACALLNPDVQVTLHLHQDGTQLGSAADATLNVLAATSGRDRSDFHRVDWELAIEDEAVWAEENPRLRSDALDLHVWVRQGDAEASLMANPMPGVVVLHHAALEAAAEASGRSLDDVARIAMLHGLGHAFGVVNAGTPFNSTATEGREGPMHHEPSQRSIMHAGWHHAGTVPKTNATYDQFSPAIRDDLEGARRSICS